FIPLVQGRDGYFYGLTSGGGYSGGGGAFFLISPSGSFAVLNNTFGNRFVSPALGYGPKFITIGEDGFVYITLDAGDLVKMTTTGSVNHIWHFDENTSFGGAPTDGVIQSHDGSLYGETSSDKYNTSGRVFKIALDGSVSTIHRFEDGSVPNDGAMPLGDLLEAPDNNLYGVTSKGGLYNQGTVFRITPSGNVTILHSFGDAAHSNSFVRPIARLALGSDQYLYGSTGSALFKISTSGVYHEFPEVPFYSSNSTAPAILATDGNIYVSTSRMLYRITPSGVTTAICAIENGNQGLAQGRDGAFYLTHPYGFDRSEDGAVYKLTLTNRVVGAISPASVQAGRGDFFLTVTGSGFLPGDTINCGGYPFPTSFGSESLLRVTIPYWLVASPQTLKVFVTNGNETPTPAPSLVVTAAPTLTRLSPASVQAGHNSFTLSVGGTGFVDGARVYWGGAVLPTTYVSPSLLTATVSAALAGPVNPLVPITVKNPNVAASNAQNFTVTDAPQITAFSPSSVQAGHRDFSLTITGTGFVRGATVYWNNTPMTTGYFSPNQLLVNVPAAYVAKYGSPQLRVANPDVAPTAISKYTVTDPIFLTWLSNDSIKAGSQSYQIILGGANFVNGARAYWNGSVLSTTYVSSSQLIAIVNGAYVKAGVPGKITVTNPYVLPTAPLTVTVTP
ncbi:MAG: choice-of-anchor tandem repeat GloVer-containing protein, partial [Capsulimonas sp.]|uniref:choice-of-anchor tandem repeat GloVer-containing protein n=1 Tax=Capsulimonas sp. TaxID=2494211 RepID=UPI00326744C6